MSLASGRSAVGRRQPVTVVIPARDDATALERCLRALERQTVPPAEVIVVDNASGDSTAAVAAAQGARVVPEPVIGIWAAAATGYDAARTPVIARLDADSLPSPDWVERISDTLARRPDAAAVTGWGVFEDLPQPFGTSAAVIYLGAYYLLGYAATARATLWGSNMAIRRSVWLGVRDRVHRTEREIHDDMDLALALGTRSIVVYAPRIVVGVSARSLRGKAQLVRRFRRALRTLSLNWARTPPWQRWAERFAAELRDIPTTAQGSLSRPWCHDTREAVAVATASHWIDTRWARIPRVDSICGPCAPSQGALSE